MKSRLVLSALLVLLASCGSEITPPSEMECAATTGAGTSHQGEISADETWTAAASPHVITFDLSIRGATLTIEPCAEVRIQPGYAISIGGTAGAAPAALVARGEVIQNADGSSTIRPITFVPDMAGTHWGSIRALPTGFIDLEHVRSSGGGAQATAQNFGGTVVVLGGGGPALNRMLRTVDVTIEDSGGLGVNLQNFGAFTEDSANLTIRGSGQEPSSSSISSKQPILVAPPAVQSLPTGVYTGNAVDEIFVFNQSRVEMDEAFRNRGVPYRFDTGFAMSPLASAADGGLITWTIEAGVRMELLETPGNVWAITLGTSNGTAPENLWPVRVIAQGTVAEPIVFTSAASAPAAGDWGGIEWAAGPQAGNILRNVRIEYAGGDSGTSGFGCGPADNDAALIIRNWRPTEAFVTELTISDSASGGIVSGWTSDEDGPNLTEGNTFTNIGNGCEVSRWASQTAPACPGNDDIPDCL